MRLYRYFRTRLRRQSKSRSQADGGWVIHSERRRAARQHDSSVGKGYGGYYV